MATYVSATCATSSTSALSYPATEASRLASAASIERRNLPQKSSSQPTLTPALYSQNSRSPAFVLAAFLLADV